MNKYLSIIVIAIVLRVFLAASSFHSDVVHFDLAGWVISSGHILDHYDYLATLPRDNPIVLVNPQYPFNYPPAIYLFHGLFKFIFSPLENSSLVFNFLSNPTSLFGNWQTNLHLLFLKFPYFFIDLAAGLLITRFFTSQKEKTIALVLWLFNPINLHATYLMGQFDIIPTFLTLLSLVFVKQNKLSWAALALGIGGAYKIYPLFFVIPLVFISDKWIERFKLVFISLIPYILQLLVYLPSTGFKSSALVASQTMKSFYSQIQLSGGEGIYLFPTFVLFSYLLFLYRRTDKETLWTRYFTVLLVFFVFTHTHPQWLLWLTPFMIIDLLISKWRHLPLTLIVLVSYLGHLSLFESSLTTQLFSPLFPSLTSAPRVWELLGINVDQYFMRSLLQSLFVAVALYWAALYNRNPHESK